MPRKKQAKRDYHTGTVYRNSPESKTWTVSWRENGMRQREGGFGSKDEGQKWLDQVVLPNIRAGKPGRPAAAALVGTNTLSAVVPKWFETRKLASVEGEKCSWRNHLAPAFGQLMPMQLDSNRLGQWVLEQLPDVSELEEDEDEDSDEGQLSPATVKNLVALVSTLYTDLIEQGVANNNPAKSLPKKIKRLLKSAHDPATTPFVRHLSTVFAIIRTIHPQSLAVAYAIGALAGLRTGEILGLDWLNVDLEQRKIHVIQQVSRNALRRPKSKKARTVLIGDSLFPILMAWRNRTGGRGLLFRPSVVGWSVYQSPNSVRKWTAQWSLALPGKPKKYRGGFDSREEATAFASEQQAQQPLIPRVGGTSPRFMSPHTLHKALDEALQQLKLPRITWYQATRHTFASQWVINRGSMKVLQKLMGHFSITTTERYARLDPEFFSEADYRRLAADPAPLAPAATPGAVPVAASMVADLGSPGALEAYLEAPEMAMPSTAVS